MIKVIIRSTGVFAVLLVLGAGLYPLTVTVLAKVFFPHQAGGSLIHRGDRIVGSEWIGQTFARPEYLHGRPSAAGAGYDAANSSGSNLGPTNKKLIDRVKSDIARVLKENPGLVSGKVPVDSVTASASGLDPHVSPETAGMQVGRIASARKVDSNLVASLVAANTESPQLGILGESRVNVLKVNLALDTQVPLRPNQ